MHFSYIKNLLAVTISHHLYHGVQTVVYDHSLYKLYVIYTLGHYTGLGLANHVYCVVRGILKIV